MTTPIGCAEAVRGLWDFIDQGLSEADRRAMEEHLAWCLRCCGELAFARELRRLLVTKSASEVPSDVQDRLESFIGGLDDATDEGVSR